MRYSCTKRFPSIPFDHRAQNHDGHCARIHGHNWIIEVTFIAHERDVNGFVFDFGKCEALKKVLAAFDHALVLNEADPHQKYLREVLEEKALAKILTVPDCSCEGLAQWFAETFDLLIRLQTNGRVLVAKVTLYEDEKNSARAELYAPFGATEYIPDYPRTGPV